MSKSLKIWVPVGAEAGIVRRQLGRAERERVTVLPMGGAGGDRLRQAVTAAVADLHATDRVVLMGLGGGLSPGWRVGDVLIYQTCIRADTGEEQECDRPLCAAIESQLRQKLPKRRVEQVRGVTGDRVIWSAAEKQHLGHLHRASVVDMEGWTVLAALRQRGIAGAIVRVVSDDCRGDIPNLDAAIDDDGTLQPWLLTQTLGSQPLTALRLIQGSLAGLWGLRRVAQATIEL